MQKTMTGGGKEADIRQLVVVLWSWSMHHWNGSGDLLCALYYQNQKDARGKLHTLYRHHRFTPFNGI
jgi:hypothetical protein